MKTIIVALAALAMLSGSALAGKEHCVSRTLSTNYNDGLNGAVSKVCYSSDSNKHEKELCETKRG